MKREDPNKQCCRCGRRGHRAHACPMPVQSAPLGPIEVITKSPPCVSHARTVGGKKA